MPILEISIMPIGTGQASFSSYISKACDVVEKHGLQYKVTPLATMVDDDMEQHWL